MNFFYQSDNDWYGISGLRGIESRGCLKDLVKRYTMNDVRKNIVIKREPSPTLMRLIGNHLYQTILQLQLEF